MSDLVQYFGFVSGAQKNQLLREADLFCFPTYYENENQPVNLIEAMAFGHIFRNTQRSYGIPYGHSRNAVNRDQVWFFECAVRKKAGQVRGWTQPGAALPETTCDMTAAYPASRGDRARTGGSSAFIRGSRSRSR